MSGWIQTPLGAVGGGLAAGLAGTLAMTAYQYLTQWIQGLASGGESENDERESEEECAGSEGSSEREDPWSDAPAPAQVGLRIITGVFRGDPPTGSIGAFTQAMHLLYGTSWGAVYGVVQATVEAPAIVAGLAFGLVVWLAGYAILVPMRIYEPFWRYPAGTVLLEISYHLVYGAAAGAAFFALGEI